MHRSLSPRLSRGLLAVAAATAVLACSSESATAPPSATRAAALALLDSARAHGNADYSSVVLGMQQELVLGAEVGTVHLTVNGTAVTYPMIAAYTVQDVGGRGFDSVYQVSAWSRTADTIWVIEDHHGPHLGLVTKDTIFGASPASLVSTVTPSRPSGACTALQPPVPPDVDVPFGVDCRRQMVMMAMSGELTLPGATMDVIMPPQVVDGIHLIAKAN